LQLLHYTKKLQANVQHYICWKFTGRLLDRVNTPLSNIGGGGERRRFRGLLAVIQNFFMEAYQKVAVQLRVKFVAFARRQHRFSAEI